MRTSHEILPPSLTARAVTYIRQGKTVTEALQQAVQDERDLILSLDGQHWKYRDKFLAVAAVLGPQVYRDIRSSGRIKR